MGDEPATELVLRHLDDLRTVLDTAGFVTKIEQIEQSGNVILFLRVINPNLVQLSEVIRCARHAGDGGALWFFWSWGEPMCPARDVHRAAKELGHVVGDGQ
ncbi:MAG TPA: hypothetical protein VFU43_15625 [Streptosporangiaceae bacterium]|nr:hypothetical protein [Streptosporangiaceae bacterium]